MRRYCDEALQAATDAGASYVDVRVGEAHWESVSGGTGRTSAIRRGSQSGVGIRVRMDGAWGFAAGPDVSLTGVRLLALEATELARASGLLLAEDTPLAPTGGVVTTWETPVTQDPFAVPTDDKRDLIEALDREVRALAAVQSLSGHLSASREVKHFASTAGSYIVQTRTVTGLGFRLRAETAHGRAVRSFPSYHGQFFTGGFEHIDTWGLFEQARLAAEEAAELTTAPPCPVGRGQVILSGSQMAALLHETCGHAAELDAVLGWESEGDPPRLVGPDSLGSTRFGSDLVTITADARLPGGLGTYGYDDEGIPAPQFNLVEGGVWRALFDNREIAGRLGLDASRGSARAAGFNRPPLVRMCNVSLEPGGGTIDDLVAGTDRGLLIDTPVNILMGGGRSRVRCVGEIGWEIDRGRIVGCVRQPSYQAETAALWQSCEAVSGPGAYALWSHPECSRGHPEQVVATSHGTVPARFSQVSFGPEG